MKKKTQVDWSKTKLISSEFPAHFQAFRSITGSHLSQNIRAVGEHLPRRISPLIQTRDRPNLVCFVSLSKWWYYLEIIKVSLKFVPRGLINNIPALVQILAWRRPGDKPLSEPMMVSLPTHICVTRPQWVKVISMLLTSHTVQHLNPEEYKTEQFRLSVNTLQLSTTNRLHAFVIIHMWPMRIRCVYLSTKLCSAIMRIQQYPYYMGNVLAINMFHDLSQSTKLECWI